MLRSVRNYFRLMAEDKQNGVLSYVFCPFLELSGWVYGKAVAFLRFSYEKKMLPRRRLPFPVVSVGNLTWGGTGKTPLVEYLARKVSERHRSPLVLTRGYSHDEVEQLKHHLPRAIVGAGKNRWRVAQEMKRKHRIDLAILDDGFQHWPIERDIEIVVINALNPFGNGKLIPRGILREPVSILKKAVIVVLQNVNLAKREDVQALKEKINKIAPKIFLVESYFEPLFFYRARKRSRVSIERLRHRRVTTFSGLGTPRSFQLLLSRCQMKPVRNFEFGDHHKFTEKEMKEIKRVSESASVDEIITTEKDFYRCPELIAKVLDPLVLAARLRIASGEEILTDRLFRLLGVTR